MKKRHIAITAVILIAVSGFTGAFCAKSSLPPEEKTKENARITKDTEVCAEIRFLYCGHSELKDPSEFTGMNKQEFKENFGGRIKEFNNGRVHSVRTVYEYCPKHLILKTDGDGQLKIMRTDGYGELNTVSVTGIFAKDISPQLKKRAAHGIVINGSEHLKKLLESS